MTSTRAAFLAAAAALLLYAPTLRHGFVWDDHVYVEASPFVREPANLLVLLSPSFYLEHGPVEAGGRPMFLATLLLDRALWGESPAGYHLTNVLLHAACAALLALLAALWTGSVPAGLAAALLFAVHPVASETVCGVSFRPDALAALFVLLALLADARARAAGGGASWSWSAAVVACFALALLSKENAAALPLLLVLGWLCSPSPPAPRRRQAAVLLMCAATLGLYAAFRVPRGGYATVAAPAVSPAPSGHEDPGPLRDAPASTVHFEPSVPEWAPAQRDVASRLGVASSTFGLYARLLLWPRPLVADRPPPAVTPAAVTLGLLALAALAAAAWAARARLPAASAGIVWFLATLAPVSGLVPLHNPAAERYLYLPLAGLALAAGAALEATARRLAPGRPVSALAALLALPLLAGAGLTAARLPAWRSDAALFADTRPDDHSRRLYNRARLAQDEGKIEDAATAYRRAAAANPRAVEPRVNLAGLEEAAGRPARALELLREAVAAAPESPVAREALGVALHRAGRLDEALAAFSEGARLDPRSASLRRRYAAALLTAGRAGQAVYEAEAAVALEPTAESHYVAGRAALEAERPGPAEEHLRHALAVEPGHVGARANLGATLHRVGRLDAALIELEEAKRLSPSSADVRRDLGVLYDDLGRGEDALRELETAVKLDARYADAWHALGVVRQKLGRLREAEHAYARSAALAPARVESASNLAGLLNMRGEPANALLILDEALKREPRRPALLHNRGDALARLGRVDEAAASYEAAVAASRAYGDPPAARAPTLTGLAECRLRQGRVEEALALSREAAGADPSYAPAREVERRALETRR